MLFTRRSSSVVSAILPLDKKLYLLVLNMELRRMTVSLLHTVAIPLPSCVVVPLQAFSVNYSPMRYISWQGRFDAHPHSYLLWWEWHCRQPISSQCWRCICSEIPWRKTLDFCVVQRRCQGQVFEFYNMAKLWNLRCVFVCENDQYGMGASPTHSSSTTEYFTRGDKIPGLQVNGMDIVAAKHAVECTRKWTVDEQRGPLLLEFITYRYGGHSMSDPGTTYRTREDVHRMRSTRDPSVGSNITLKNGVRQRSRNSSDSIRRPKRRTLGGQPLDRQEHPATLPERPQGGPYLYPNELHHSLLFIRFLSFFSFRWTLYNEIHTYLHCSLCNAIPARIR